MTNGRHRVVIVGGGFGGIRVTRALARADADVTIVDRANHHLFQPLLYQVATGILPDGLIAPALRGVVRKQANARVVLAEVQQLDLDARVVRAEAPDGRKLALPYDSLVVAAGSTDSYFGHDEWASFAPGLKTLRDAGHLRSHILGAFEMAELASGRRAGLPAGGHAGRCGRCRHRPHGPGGGAAGLQPARSPGGLRHRGHGLAERPAGGGPAGDPGGHVRGQADRGAAGRPDRREALQVSRPGQHGQIGHLSAVADSFGMKFTGVTGYTMWGFVHVLYLIGWGNRVAAMYNWARALTFAKNRPHRTITAERVRYELSHHTEAEP
jgi:NADH dehydrogenase FAD-containing subunit